jgi:hypothetical protein
MRRHRKNTKNYNILSSDEKIGCLSVFQAYYVKKKFNKSKKNKRKEDIF